jgi:hypothetical protein
MYKYIILIGLLLFSCAVSPPPKIIIMPPTKKKSNVEQNQTLFSLGYMSGYDVWEFLKEQPAEKEVIDTFGLPDSVWLDDVQSTKFLYYFISEMQDYNTIEISTQTDSVSGFEWD